MQTYVAKSIFASKTFWINVAMFFLAAMELTDVTKIIPEDWGGSIGAVIALVNLALRFTTTRPVALISPGTTKAVSVASLPYAGGRGGDPYDPQRAA